MDRPVESRHQVLQRMRERVRGRSEPDRSVVDELLEERQAEATAECDPR